MGEQPPRRDDRPPSWAVQTEELDWEDDQLGVSRDEDDLGFQ